MALPKPGILKKLTLRMGMTFLGGFNLLLLAASGMLGYWGEHAANAVLIGVGGIASLIVGVSLMGNIDGRLKRIIRVFEDIAEGNLNERIEIDGQDELGQVLASLACMQIHLKVILDEVALASQVIQSRSGDLQHEIKEVVAHSQSQSDRVLQVSTAMEQMSGAIRDVAESAKGAAQAAGETQSIVESGNAKMAQSVGATSRVVAAVQASSGTIAELNQSIQKIGEITNTIKDIADQTNLLALNAAIEAARAGEQGRGFAVVADEVRKLAERTASSTADISQMVGSIKAATGAAVQAMSQAGEEVETGLVLIRATGSSLEEIRQASDRVNDMARQIAGAADQQSSAGSDIAGNLEQIAALANENTQSIRQVDAAAEVLARVANDLQVMVKHFDN